MKLRISILLIMLLPGGATVAQEKTPAPAAVDWTKASAGPAEFHQDFRCRDPNPAFVRPTGEQVRWGPEGVRVVLPPGQPKQPAAGLTAEFSVHGDFEITASYRILKADKPDTGYGVGVSLWAAFDPKSADTASMSRRVRKEGTTLFVSDRARPEAGGVKHQVKRLPSRADTGRLRLQRVGGSVRFLGSDNADGEFVALDETSFGTGDVRWLQIGGQTGGSSSGLELLILDLSVRAESLPGLPDTSVAQEFKGEYRQNFEGQSALPPGWNLYGPGADDCVHSEESGLRLALPAGSDGERPHTGISTDRTVRGNFDITLDFEILKEPAPPEAGSGTRLTLVLVTGKLEATSTVATISRSVGAKLESCVVTYVHAPDQSSGKLQRRSHVYPTKATRGRLRLVRQGTDIFFLTADGADDEYVFRQKYPFGGENIEAIRIVGSTGGPRAALEVRVRELRLRSTGGDSAPAQAAAPESSGELWPVLVLLAVVLMGAGGVVWLKRRPA